MTLVSSAGDPGGTEPTVADAVGPVEVGPAAPEPGPPPEVAFRVVSGHPTPQEVAALVTVLSVSALSAGPSAGEATGARSSPWADPARRLVGPPRDHGGWRRSALPR
ncbi:MAG: acyl-CoA carboxylase subunit epsilon [Terracoccus sp.]